MGRVKPLVLTSCGCLLGVVHLAADVRTVGVAAAEADWIVADRQTRTLVVARGLTAGLVDDGSGEFPSTEHRLGKTGALGEERQVVDVVGAEDVTAIKLPRTLVVLQVAGVADACRGHRW